MQTRALVSTLFGLIVIAAGCGTGVTTGAGDDGDEGGGGAGGDGEGGGDGSGGGDGGGDFGADHECYGIADDLGEVFAIDRATGQATHLCSVPDQVAEIDAISSHPVTGIYYYVSQSSAELGWFDPDGCEFHALGAIEVTDIAGLSFHPETAVLYAGDQSTGELYRFGQDTGGVPTPEMTLVAPLPATPKAIAIEPASNRAFVSDAAALAVVDLATGEAGALMPMSTDRVEALFFTVDGALHGVVDKDGTLANHFVDVDPATAAVTDVGPMNPVVYLPGSDARPAADDVEAMECNVGGACNNCDVE
jgi:hypothetical protein